MNEFDGIKRRVTSAIEGGGEVIEGGSMAGEDTGP